MRRKKMSNFYNKFFPILLIFATLFMGIGYAAINSTSLAVSGEVASLGQTGIFITEINYVDDTNANVGDSKNQAYNTILDSKIILSETDPNSSVTYEISIYNSYDLDFTFIDVVYDSSFYDNENIIFEIDLVPKQTVIDAKGELTFTITFKYKDGVVPSSSVNVLNSYLNFRFLHPVNYIESTGTQYLDTGIVPDNTTTFDITFAFHTVYETQAILGTRAGMDDGASFNLFLHKKVEHEKWRLRWDEGSVTGEYVDLPVNEWKKINVVKGIDTVTFTSNGQTVTQDISNETWTLDSSIYLFTQNQSSVSEERRAKIKLYDFKIYKNGSIVREFVPVLDQNGTACLYDKVSNEYFHNIGEDEFGYSMHANIYNYVESSGTQYIDLGLAADEYTEVQFVMSLNSNYTTTQGIFGGRVSAGSRAFNMFWYNSALRWDYNNTTNSLTSSATYTEPTYIAASASDVNINLETISFDNSTAFDTGNNMYLFAVNNSGSPVFLNSGMRIYYFKVLYDGQVIRNLIPATSPDGVPCFYDLVDQTFFYNKGSGNFIVSK